MSVVILELEPVAPSVLPDAMLLDDLIAVGQQRARLDAQFAALVAEAHTRGVCERADGVGTISWLAEHTHLSRKAAGAMLRLGSELRDRLPQVAELFRTGVIGVQQATQAVAAIRDLPKTATADRPDVDVQLRQTDTLLATLAQRFTTDDFARMAREIGDHLATDGGKRSRRDQHDARGLFLSKLLDGSWRMDATLDTESGATVHTVLDVLSRPLGKDDDRTPAQRRADALVELCQHYLNTGEAPHRGGVQPHLNVVIDAAALTAAAEAWNHGELTSHPDLLGAGCTHTGPDEHPLPVGTGPPKPT